MSEILYVFDKDMAKQILASEEYDYAMVGLLGDWNATAVSIEFKNKKLKIREPNTLSSVWATPAIKLYKKDGDWVCEKIIRCFKKEIA